MTISANRRLAAILAADVANYSGLVRADEDGVVRALQELQANVIDPLIDRHSGRIANTAGDSLLVEFPSAVEAVRCGIAIQNAVAETNKAGPDTPSLRFRIGVNVGDVITAGDDLLGDGVNLAARIEALAEPGEVLVSRAVADFMRSMDDVGLTPLGAKRVKNIPEAVEVFRVVPKGAQSMPPPRSQSRRWNLVAVLAVVVVLVLGWVWWDRTQNRVEAASQDRMSFPLPDKPSIAVLPFEVSAEGDTILADGLSDDLITDLSKIPSLFVIAGNSSFAYRQAETSIAQFSEALGVRYVVDGSVRRVGDLLRVNARLTEATTGQVVWADRYEGEVETVFDMQSQVVASVVAELGLSISDAEMVQITRPDTRQVAAREAFQRGWALYGRFNENDNTAAIPHFERAIELDPDYGRAYGALALAHLRPHLFHHWNNYLPGGDTLHITRFYQYMERASKYETALVHVIGAMIRLNLRDITLPVEGDFGTDAARREAARAIALSPSDPEAHIAMAWALIAGGQPEEGLNFVNAAKRLDPINPSHYTLFDAAGHYALGDLETAAAVLTEGLVRAPQARELIPVLASIRAQLGQRQSARTLLDQWQSGENPAALEAAVDDYFFVLRWSGEQEGLNNRLKTGLQLAALPANVTVETLRFALGGGDSVRQLKAVRSLALFGPAASDAVPEIIEVLNSDSAILRKSAVVTLGSIGPAAAAAIPTLEAIDPNSLIGRHAQKALDQIRPR